MKVVNLYAGPGAGKSTAAAHLFAKLKSHHISTELVGEFAKELIYLGNDIQLANQVYILGCQYRKLVDLKRHGISVAISDSPLLLQLVYCQGQPYYEEIAALVQKLNSEFDNIDVYLNRVNPYQIYGRVHSELEAKHIDLKIKEALHDNFHYQIDANLEGLELLETEIVKLVDKELLAQF